MTATVLLININNTNTTFALADERRIQRVVRVPTRSVRRLPSLAGRADAVVLASVVPEATRRLRPALPKRPLLVSARTDLGIGIDYPNPAQIGADRLANAVGVTRLYGAPAIVVDFGTAVTFDLINARGAYVGGVIAPGLAAVTDYLYQRTALLPRIKLAEPRSIVGRSTVEAMRVGAVIGYRGLVKEILTALQRQRNLRRAVVVATGGYGHLVAERVPSIQAVHPLLTMEGLRFIWLHQRRGKHNAR